MEALHLGLHVAESDALQEIAELGADERIAAELKLMIVERHPITQRAGAVGIEEKGGVQDFAADKAVTQKRMVEAGLLGKKSGKGYYDYGEGALNPKPREDPKLGEQIMFRILVMLINEAADEVFLGIASKEDVDLAMTKGVNYPKGLLRWADEIGLEKVLAKLEDLQSEYGEDRYRPNPLLKRMVRMKEGFYS